MVLRLIGSEREIRGPQEPPFCFTDEAGKVLGCDVELAQTVCKSLACRFSPIDAEFSELLPRLAADRWTMTTGLFVSAERERSSTSRGRSGRERRAARTPGKSAWTFGLSVHFCRPEATLGVITDQIQHKTALENGVLPNGSLSSPRRQKPPSAWPAAQSMPMPASRWRIAAIWRDGPMPARGG